MIITRYLAKEVYTTLVATTIVLLLIFISNQLVRFLQFAAAGELSSRAVVLLLLLTLPYLLSLLLPLSLFLSILLAYGRLYSDSEMTVLSASGLSPNQLLRITVKFSLLVVVLVGILSLWVTPTVSRYSDQIQSGKASTLLEILLPNRFQPISNGKWIFYVGSTSRDKKNLQEIFAAEQPDVNPSPTNHSIAPLASDINTKNIASNHESNPASQQRPLGIIFAKNGHQRDIDNSDNPILVLTDGYRYEGVPGQKNFKVIKYKEYGLKIQQTTNNWREDESNASTISLWQKRSDKLAAAEIQWRISMPIMALVLTLLGCVLSKIKPKRIRYAQILPAAICYIGYAQLIFLSRAWIKKGILPPIIGMWWVHIIMIALVVFLFAKLNSGIFISRNK